MTTAENTEDKGSHPSQGLYDVLDFIWEIPGLTEKCSAADLVILGKTYTITSSKTNIKAENTNNNINESNDIDISQDSIYEQPVIVFDVINTTSSHDELTNNNSNTNIYPELESKLESESTLNHIKSFFNKISNSNTQVIPNDYKEDVTKTSYSVMDLPHEFLDDMYTRLWFTYRSGFPIIERDKNGPSPLSLGSILRGSFDLHNMGKGFTSDSGWGCMIRTSQSLLANALMSLKLGRDWNINNSSFEDLESHWYIVEQFADVPDANYSIQNYVYYAAKYCGRRPGEWFGPSNAAKSIQKLCEEKPCDINLKVYISTDSGDMFDDELLKLSKCENNDNIFNSLLILCGVRLGIQTINPVYWDFLRFVLQLPYSVGISGGRPSSSHYFFGYQSDYLFYLDPHLAQNAILLEQNGHIKDTDRQKLLETIHSKKLRKIHISKIDPSMLIGFLIKNKNDYNDFKEKINSFDPNKRFLNIYHSRPLQIPELVSHGSELDGFIDLGIESINEEEEEEDDDDGDKENVNDGLNLETEMEEDNIIDKIKEEIPVKIENNLVVDAFDLCCDPSTDERSSIKVLSTSDNSLVVHESEIEDERTNAEEH
ncbi:Cysteine protease atg4 [Pichia californica]|uniref:Cysteine protease n=1 Tax=Pichia californica TaxID=460514 RepID=A0A9P7BDX3_9ASCO|nr:Cysteine protease atg4 [[Candida] californica]